MSSPRAPAAEVPAPSTTSLEQTPRDAKPPSPPKASSPKSSSPKAASPKAASPKAASPKAASPKAASPRAAPSLQQLLNPVEDVEAPEPLQVDYDAYAPDDNDSTYGSDSATNYTASVSSSIYHYQYENGRRYHAYREGQYVLPNDDQEQERLDLQHHIWRLLLGGSLYTAPLPSPGEASADGADPPADGSLRILDLGCGTGIWAIDMADEFPHAHVFGVDLSPIQPDWVPPNCKFHVDDYEDTWTYGPDERFDYIHGRALSGTSADWARFYRNVRENLVPGGYVEMQEYDAWIFSDDDSIERAPWTMEWVEKLDKASHMFGKPINIARYHKQWMEEAGFEDVKEVVYRIPIGPWAKDPTLKELGRYELTHMQMSVDSHTPALFTRVWNYSNDQAGVLMEGVKREFRSKELRLITCYRFITGRRPMKDGEVSS